jgi:hypothetical protein
MNSPVPANRRELQDTGIDPDSGSITNAALAYSAQLQSAADFVHAFNALKTRNIDTAHVSHQSLLDPDACDLYFTLKSGEIVELHAVIRQVGEEPIDPGMLQAATYRGLTLGAGSIGDELIKVPVILADGDIRTLNCRAAAVIKPESPQ